MALVIEHTQKRQGLMALVIEHTKKDKDIWHW